jgi:hypothetical protein
MDAEQIEKAIEKSVHVESTMGFMTAEHYSDFKYHAQEGLIRYGGSFAKNLGLALQSADVNNAIKIMKLWFSLCDEHCMLHKIFIAKRDARIKENEQKRSI